MSTRGRVFYRWLLRLLPRSLRDEFGSEMEELFAARLAERTGIAARAREYVHAVGDVVSVAFEERVRGGAVAGVGATAFGDRIRIRRLMQGFATTTQAVAFALRSARRSTGLATGVVVAFALGIGANVTMFGIVDRLLLSPPAHIADAGSVRRLEMDRYVPEQGRRETGGDIMLEDYLYQKANARLTGVAAMGSRWMLSIGRGEAAQRVPAQTVTASFWAVLGVRPALGRFFTEAEDRPGEEGRVVISRAFWQQWFGSDPGALGRTIDIAGFGTYTIVGVAPAGFTGVDLAPVDLWLPALQSTRLPDQCCYYWLSMVARLAPGASPAAAEQQATALYRSGRAEQGRADNPESDPRIVATPLIAARGPNRSAVVDVAVWLGGVSALILIVACVNVTNLLVARSIRQRRRTAVQLALGISRGRLAFEVLIEVLVLALAGGAAAMLVASAGGSLLRSLLLPDVLWTDPVEMSTWALSLGLAAAAGLTAAVLPLREAWRAQPADTLRGDRGGITRGTIRAREALVLVQAAVCTLLLVGAGLFVRSLDQVRSIDLGFEPDGLVIAGLQLDAGVVRAPREQVFREAIATLQRRPDVIAAAASAEFPFGNSSALDVRVRGREALPQLAAGGPYINVVTRDYLPAMDLQVLRGRGFAPHDVQGSEPVTVVNRTFADVIRPGAGDAAIGECLILDDDDGPCATIVGIVEDGRRDAVIEPPNAMYYVLSEQRLVGWSPSVLLVRVAGDAASAAPGLRTTLLESDARLRDVTARPYDSLIDPQVRSWTLGASLFGGFGVLALIVALSGLYSMLAFDIAQRTREIGLRAALGADAQTLTFPVVGRALRIVGAGMTLGLAASAILSRRVAPLLYEVSPLDPVTFAAVMGVLLTTAVAASWIPAVRAARLNPNVCLNQSG